jgi:hypothetical protein
MTAQGNALVISIGTVAAQRINGHFAGFRRILLDLPAIHK